MSDHKGVVLLMYDLPADSPMHRRDYSQFRKGLLEAGCLRLQESVYMKLIYNIDLYSAEVSRLKKAVPKEGSINILPMTLGNFKSFQAIRGEPFNFELFADDVIFF